MPTVKIPPMNSWDRLLITIKPRPKESFRELLTDTVALRALRDHYLHRQGISTPTLPLYSANTTALGLEVANSLVKRFEQYRVFNSVAEWQSIVHYYEQFTDDILRPEREDLLVDINSLKYTETMQEINRALAYLQCNYFVPAPKVREGELSGMANPDLVVRVIPPDSNGQCPAGTMWSARVGGCVSIDDGTASTGFDTSRGGNRADSDLRKARGGTERTQFTPEGTRVLTDAGNRDRLHPDTYGTPNRAMGNSSIEVSDRNIDTQQMPGGQRISRQSPDALNRLREGELSGMANPDKQIEVIPADANGQCHPGYIYSARLGGCIRIEDSVASTGFDITQGGNRADSDLRKARSRTNRTRFTPEGTRVLTDAGENDRLHPDTYGTANRAMGDAGIEFSDVGIQTQEMPGGQRLLGLSPDALNRMRERYKDALGFIEGELSGMANPDVVVQGVPPDHKGQCPDGYIWSAQHGLCIELPDDQKAVALRKNRGQHTPEGVDTLKGTSIARDNSGQPNPAMGFSGPLAMLTDEGWRSLSTHWMTCMLMLKEATDPRTKRPFSFYASKNASYRYCFFLHEGLYDGYVNGRDEIAHAQPLEIRAYDRHVLDEWLGKDKDDYEAKEHLRYVYEVDRWQRFKHRPSLEQAIRSGSTDHQIQAFFQRQHYPRQLVRSLMTDVAALRMTLKPLPKSNRRVNIRM